MSDEQSLFGGVPGEDNLRLEYVALSSIRRWNKNPKRHGLQTIKDSILQHGFKDPLKFEPALNDGLGGIVEGNGRDEALLALYDEWKILGDGSLPRGVVVREDDWLVPVLFGVDAPSEAAAEAYGIDHNNTVLPTADVTAMLSLWNETFIGLINSDDINPITVPIETRNLLEGKTNFERPDFSGIVEQFAGNLEATGESREDGNWFYIEFYGNDDRWNELRALLEPHMKSRSGHEIDPEFFYQMVTGYLNNDNA